jgi:hypothetical protein
MAAGWSTKELQRLILASSVYQMAASNPAEALAAGIDPENRLLWKFRLQRLEAEQIRDAVLAVSGRLDQRLGGKSVPLRTRQFVFDHTSIDHTRYDSLRRAAYLPVIRNNVYTFLEQFDFPDPTMPTGNRASTVVAPQALLLMNAELVMDSADALARDLLGQPGDDAGRIQLAYQRAFARPASPAETRRAAEFIHRLTDSLNRRDHAADNQLNRRDHAANARVAAGVKQDATAELPIAAGVKQDAMAELPIAAGVKDADGAQRAWSLFCQSLFASNEFIYVR